MLALGAATKAQDDSSADTADTASDAGDAGYESEPQQYTTAEAYEPAGYTFHSKICNSPCPAEAPCMNSKTGACLPRSCDGGYEGGYEVHHADYSNDQQSGYRRLADDSGDASDAGDAGYGEAATYEPTYSTAEYHHEEYRPSCGCPEGTSDARHLVLHKRWPLWTGFGLLAFPALLFLWRTFEDLRRNGNLNDKNFGSGDGIHRLVAGAVCMIASLAYLTMSLGHGYIVRCCDGRSFYYARYIDWFFTTPLMLWELAEFSGASNVDRIFIIVLDILMVISGLIGALICDSEKWAFWGFGILCFLPILWYLCAWDKKANAGANLTDAQKTYKTLMNITVVTWFVYPIIWICSEGTGKISVYGEAIAYTVLDVLSKSVFGWVIVSSATRTKNSGNDVGSSVL